MVIVSAFAWGVNRLLGGVPLENIDRWNEWLVVNLLKRVQVILNPHLLFGQVLVNHEVETRHLLVVRCRHCAFLRHVNSRRVSCLLFNDVEVQGCSGFLLDVFSVWEGFLDLLYSNDLNVVARNFVDGVDSLSTVQLPEDIRSKRIVRDSVACLMAHNHLAYVIVNLNFTFAKFCLKLSCGNLSLSEFLNSVGDIILEVIDGLYLWFD